MLNEQSRIAVFDLDDTLACFKSEFSRFLVKKYKDVSFVEDLRAQGPWEVRYPWLKIEEELAEFEESGGILRLPVREEVHDMYRLLQALDYKMVILTARGWMKQPELETNQWLESNGIRADKLIIVPLDACKSEYIPEGTELFFDDHGGHAVNCAPKCTMVHLVNQKWNAHLTDLPENVHRFGKME